MSQPDADWVPFVDIDGDGFERRQRVRKAIRPHLPELMLCMRAMDDPDDISAASGASYMGFPGGANFAVVDFVGNALVVRGRMVPGDFALTLTYFPGWFLQVLIRGGLIPHWDAPPDRGPDFFRSEPVGQQIDTAVRHAESARPLQITLQQDNLFSKDKTARPFHYHYQPSFWHALTNREDGEPDTTILDSEELLRVEWSQPRLTLSLMPGVRSHVSEILKSTREICYKEFLGHNSLMLDFAEMNTPGAFATQSVNFDYRRHQDGTLPRGWSRNAPRAGQFTISDCLPPLAEIAAFGQDALREPPTDPDYFDEDEALEEAEFGPETRDPYDGLDPDLGAEADNQIPLEEAVLSWPQGDIPFRRFDRPGGACFAFFSKHAIMNRLKDERDALEIFLAEDDVMFTMIPRMINWLASPAAWDPLFSPDALLLDVVIDDPSDPNQRFRVDAVPLDADYNAQTPPYDLSKLPEGPPWYRVNIQHTEGVSFGIRSHKEFLSELSNGGANYVEINARNRALHFDDFLEPDPGRMSDLTEGNGYVDGDKVLSTTFTHEDVIRALSHSIPIAADQMALIVGFTPAGILADIYDGANLIVFGATYALTGQGRDLFLRKATPGDAASMAVGLLPFLPTGKANKAVLNLISLSWGVKDIGMMGYEISRSGSRTHQLRLAEAEELFKTIKGEIGTGPGSR